MGQLTSLNLSQNKSRYIPSAVAQLAALRELSIMYNQDLRLILEDVEVLSALCKLRKVDLSKDIVRQSFVKRWSGDDIAVVWALCKRMPDLDCIFLPKESAWQ